MRLVTQSDVTAAARRLWTLPRDDWQATMRRALTKAHAADRFRKRQDRCHPLWGDGSLGAAIRADGGLPAEPFLSDCRSLEALGEAIHAILEWRRRQNVKE
jgi:hypothetical protein